MKARLLTALRASNSPWQFIEEVTRNHRLRVEMRVTLEYRVWHVDLTVEADLNPNQFDRVWTPMRQRGYLREVRLVASHNEVRPENWDEELVVYRRVRTYFNYGVSLVFSKEFEPMKQFRYVDRWQFELPRPV